MAETSAANSVVQDVPQAINLDFGVALERIDAWVDGAIRLLPNLVVAAVLLLIFYGVGLLVRRLIVRQMHRRERDNLGEVLGGFVKWLIFLLGFLLAATIVLPSLKPSDLIAGLGVSSVAIGFAFKDILQNWLAGLLILLRQPFDINDQISINSHEGTVERIETRATIIKTYDGQRIVVPNSDIYTQAVRVLTAHEFRRSEYQVGIGYDDDLDTACALLVAAVSKVAEVEQAPMVEALPWDLAPSWVTIKVRWWTRSHKADVTQVHAQVIRTIKHTLEEADISMPGEAVLFQLQDSFDEEEFTEEEPKSRH
ncbi:mechanosensitive ion channel family protein [Oceanisphaera sp. W20_SRM_FM3]|uniref:mechanosensitive ion channel family protein n=1 Tax=Oceanisphaera sp. W20_SRM_FM3 TaxID=3240267 RepID=UPI003F9D5AA5